jgi:hypothetical protein
MTVNPLATLGIAAAMRKPDYWMSQARAVKKIRMN